MNRVDIPMEKLLKADIVKLINVLGCVKKCFNSFVVLLWILYVILREGFFFFSSSTLNFIKIGEK